MASSYTTSLKIQEIGNGEQAGIWGSTTNTNWTLIEQAVAGVQTITMANSSYTLSNLNGTLDEARNAVLVITGTNSGVYQVIAPLVTKTFIVSNQTTGGYAITIGGASGSVITIPNGLTTIVYCDGTNFYSGITGLTGNQTVSGNLTVAGSATAASFSGAGTGLTGTAASLSIGGNAATATNATNATNADNLTGLSSGTGASLVGYNEGATGAVTTTAQAKFQEVLSVKDFGATGNGTTDDTSAVQAALNALLASATANVDNGATLYFPKGVYKCGALTFNPSSSVTRFGRITIRGDKGSSIILSTVTTGQIALSIGVYAGINNFGGWLFEGMYFKSANFQGTGLQFNATNWNALVDNCIFLGFDYNYANYSGITTTIQNSIFGSAAQWNYFSAPASTGISGYDETPANLRFENNYVGQGFNDSGTVVYSQRGIGSTNTTYGLGRGAVIKNNVFEGNALYAVWVGSSSGTTNDNTVIDSNWFESPGSNLDQINGGLIRSSITNNYSSIDLLANYGNTLDPFTGINVIYSNFKFGLGNQYGTILPLAKVDTLSVNSDGTYAPNEGEISLTGYNQAQIFTRNHSAASGRYWQIGADSTNSCVVYNQANTGVYITNGGTSWTANSDETLKTDLTPIADAVAKVNTLRSVTGRYKTDAEGTSRSFLIAQDVKAVLPEAVNTQENGILGLQYSDVIPLLVAAIKELSAEFEAYKASHP